MSFSVTELEAKRATFCMQRDQILGQYNQLCGAIFALDELINQMKQSEAAPEPEPVSNEEPKDGEEIHS
jgi:hypothetical protein